MGGSNTTARVVPTEHGALKDASAGASDREPQTADEILDHYMSTTPYYKQTMLSASVALASVWRKQVLANGAYETRDKLKSFWTNIALVSALLLGVSYSSATNPVSTVDPSLKTAVAVASVFTGVSTVFSLAVIVVSVIYLVEIDNCVTERDLRDFIMANAPFVDILTGVFSGSVVTLLLSALATMFITYQRTEFMIVTCVSGVTALLGVVFAAIVAGRNRFRLWIRFDSPEGKMLVAQLKDGDMRELRGLHQELMFQIQELRELKELKELKEVKDALHELHV